MLSNLFHDLFFKRARLHTHTPLFQILFVISFKSEEKE